MSNTINLYKMRNLMFEALDDKEIALKICETGHNFTNKKGGTKDALFKITEGLAIKYNLIKKRSL